MSSLSSDPWMIAAPQVSTSTPSETVPFPGGDVEDDYPRDLGKVGILLCVASSLISISSISSVVMYLVG